VNQNSPSLVVIRRPKKCSGHDLFMDKGVVCVNQELPNIVTLRHLMEVMYGNIHCCIDFGP